MLWGKSYLRCSLMARCFRRGTSRSHQKTHLCHPERSRRVSCTPLEILQLRFAPFRMTTRAVFMSVRSHWFMMVSCFQTTFGVKLNGYHPSKKTLDVSTEKVLNETASSLNEKLDVIPSKACSYENGGGNPVLSMTCTSSGFPPSREWHLTDIFNTHSISKLLWGKVFLYPWLTLVYAWVMNSANSSK